MNSCWKKTINCNNEKDLMYSELSEAWPISQTEDAP